MSSSTVAPGAPRILVIEDDPRTADWLRRYLEQPGWQVTMAGDGPSGLAALQEAAPDLVLLDVMLPGSSGWDVCRAIREQGDTPVIMLTARSSESDRLRGFDIGADDYIVKPFSPREVVARVKAVLRRAREEDDTPADVRRIGRFELDARELALRSDGRPPVRLTPVECRLLGLLGRAPGRVFQRGEIVDRLFGPDDDGGDRRVDVHVRNLRRKLEDAGIDPSVIDTVRGVGYRLADAH